LNLPLLTAERCFMRSNLRTSRFIIIPFLSLMTAFFLSALCIAADEQVEGPRIEFEHTRHDFGLIGQNIIVAHEFVFHNVGSSILQIESVESPCSCTASLLSSDSIAPGESGTVEVAFSSDMRLGTTKNSVTVRSNDSVSPEAIIEIIAEVEPQLAVEPHPLVFDIATDVRERIVKVTRVNNAAPRIMGVKTSAEHLVAETVSMDDIIPGIGESETETFVRVRLVDTNVETPSEEAILIFLEAPPGAVYNLPVILKNVQHVSIIPPVVAFGIVKKGTGASKVIRVVSDGTANLELMKVIAIPHTISATFLRSDSRNEMVCNVEIKASAPPGFVNGEIIITGGEDGPVVAKVPVFALIKD